MAERPVRLQLSRKKGFNLQALSMATNGLPAVNVARPSQWGNPFVIVNDPTDRTAVVDRYRRMLTVRPSLLRSLMCSIARSHGPCGEGHFLSLRLALPSLAGKNLACWCKIHQQPCHADVLLELANSPDTGEGR